MVIVNETAVTQHPYVAAALTLTLSLDWTGRGIGNGKGKGDGIKKSQTHRND